MIAQDEQIKSENVAAQAPVPPQIKTEIDIPFSNLQSKNTFSRPGNLSETASLDDEITRFKYLTGKKVLFISMGAMGVAVAISVILSCFSIENALVENAFEVFKLIAMTVLGYIFGSKTK